MSTQELTASEDLSKWIPMDDIPAVLYLEGLHDDYEGFRILLRGAAPIGKMLRIAFDPAFSYRRIDEGDLLQRMKAVCNPSWPLLLVSNSEYLAWFHRESLDRYQGVDIKHYLILTSNDCVEVLSSFPPKVEWL